jgi:hypothetical protein
LSLSTGPFFFFFFFWGRVWQTICLGWLLTTILLISTSWVARITSVCCLQFFRHKTPECLVAISFRDLPRKEVYFCSSIFMASKIHGYSGPFI